MWNDLKVSFFLAYKSILKGNRAILILIPAVIGVSIANLAFSDGLFAGIIDSLNKQLVNNLFSNIVIEPRENKQYIEGAENIRHTVLSLPGVVWAASHYKTSGAFSFDKEKNNLHVKKGGYQVIGIDPEEEKKVTTISQYMLEGQYLSPDDRDEILIGAEVAGGGRGVYEKISLGGVNVGDKIRVSYPNGVAKDYKVKGIFKSGIDGIDIMTFVTNKELESVLGLHNSASEILVKTEKTGEEQVVISEMRQSGLTKEKIESWEIFSNYAGMLKNSFGLIGVITGFVSVVVACATIFIVVFINVVNRRRQIGILKAIGLDPQVILNSYIFQTAFYSLLGAIINAIIIYFIAVPYFKKSPINMGFGMVGLSVETQSMLKDIGLVFAASLISGFIPAWRTIRQKIIDSIWGV